MDLVRFHAARCTHCRQYIVESTKVAGTQRAWYVLHSVHRTHSSEHNFSVLDSKNKLSDSAVTSSKYLYDEKADCSKSATGMPADPRFL